MRFIIVYEPYDTSKDLVRSCFSNSAYEKLLDFLPEIYPCNSTCAPTNSNVSMRSSELEGVERDVARKTSDYSQKSCLRSTFSAATGCVVLLCMPCDILDMIDLSTNSIKEFSPLSVPQNAAGGRRMTCPVKSTIREGMMSTRNASDQGLDLATAILRYIGRYLSRDDNARRCISSDFYITLPGTIGHGRKDTTHTDERFKESAHQVRTSTPNCFLRVLLQRALKGCSLSADLICFYDTVLRRHFLQSTSAETKRDAYPGPRLKQVGEKSKLFEVPNLLVAYNDACNSQTSTRFSTSISPSIIPVGKCTFQNSVKSIYFVPFMSQNVGLLQGLEFAPTPEKMSTVSYGRKDSCIERCDVSIPDERNWVELDILFETFSALDVSGQVRKYESFEIWLRRSLLALYFSKLKPAVLKSLISSFSRNSTTNPYCWPSLTCATDTNSDPDEPLFLYLPSGGCFSMRGLRECHTRNVYPVKTNDSESRLDCIEQKRSSANQEMKSEPSGFRCDVLFSALVHEVVSVLVGYLWRHFLLSTEFDENVSYITNECSIWLNTKDKKLAEHVRTSIRYSLAEGWKTLPTLLGL